MSEQDQTKQNLNQSRVFSQCHQHRAIAISLILFFMALNVGRVHNQEIATQMNQSTNITTDSLGEEQTYFDSQYSILQSPISSAYQINMTVKEEFLLPTPNYARNGQLTDPDQGPIHMMYSQNSDGYLRLHIRNDSNYVQVWDNGGEFTGCVVAAYGDTNGDGEMEIIAGAGHIADQKIIVYNKTGEYTYQNIWQTGTPAEVWSINADDLDGDGCDEIIVGTKGAGLQIYAFQAPNTYILKYQSTGFSGNIHKVDSADLDNNGKQDVVFAAGNQLVLLECDSLDNISVKWQSPVHSSEYYYFSFGSVFRQDLPDILAHDAASTTSIFTNPGNNQFWKILSIPNHIYPISFDYDQNNYMELVTVHNGDLYGWQVVGPDELDNNWNSSLIEDYDLDQLFISDVDFDGKPEILAICTQRGTNVIFSYWEKTIPPAPILNQIAPNISTTGYVSLNWTSIPNIDYYNVYKSNSPITEIGSLQPIAASFQNWYEIYLNLSSIYYFAVTAYNYSGESNISNCVNVEVSLPPTSMVQPILSPPMPNPSLDGKITLSWTEDFWTTNYTIYRAESPIANISQLIPLATINTTSYQDQLSSFGRYYYSVLARNETATAPLSNCVNVTYFQAALQTPQLQAITPNPSLNGTINLEWIGISGAEEYEIYQSFSPIELFGGLTLIDRVATTSYRRTLDSNGTYYFAILACNSTGTSNMSNNEMVTITILPHIPTAPLLAMIIPNPSSTGILDLSWEDEDEFISYFIYRHTQITIDTSQINPIQSTLIKSFQDTIQINGTYYYMIVGLTENGKFISSNIQGVIVAIPPEDQNTGDNPTDDNNNDDSNIDPSDPETDPSVWDQIIAALPPGIQQNIVSISIGSVGGVMVITIILKNFKGRKGKNGNHGPTPEDFVEFTF